MNNQTWRHHYIPVFYQKGFTHDKFLVFNKEKWSFLPKKQSPRSIFYEENRNTCKTESGETDILETSLFSTFDNRFSVIINELRNTNCSSVYSRGTLEEYFIFINFLKLRNPIYDRVIENIFNENDFIDLGYNIVSIKDSSPVDGNIKKMMQHDELFIKSHAVSLSVLPFIKDETLMTKVLNNHSFYYHSHNHNLSLFGDNPVILKSDNE